MGDSVYTCPAAEPFFFFSEGMVGCSALLGRVTAWLAAGWALRLQRFHWMM